MSHAEDQDDKNLVNTATPTASYGGTDAESEGETVLPEQYFTTQFWIYAIYISVLFAIVAVALGLLGCW